MGGAACGDFYEVRPEFEGSSPPSRSGYCLELTEPSLMVGLLPSNSGRTS